MGTTYTQFNHGQWTQLGNDVNIAVVTALPKVAAKFDPKSLLKALEGKGQFVADKLGPALEQIFNSLFVLGTPGTVNITLTKPHDPNIFFQTRSGLWVSADFQRLVVSNAKPVKAGTVFNLDHALLTKDMTDAEIEAALPTEHLVDESTACAAIAAMITEQEGGKEGKLLNNGYANLLFLRSCVVNVYWLADSRGWSVLTWLRGDWWSAGNQIFSPATATL